MRFFWQKATDAEQKSAFSQPEIWSRMHPLNMPIFDTGTSSDRERIENDFEGYVFGALKRNGAVFACSMARNMVFSEARFQWRQFTQGRPGELFGTPGLSLLERPWVGGTTGELLSHMLQDADFAGNSWWTLADDKGKLGKAAVGGENVRMVRLRPDWVSMIIGSRSGDPQALDGHVIAIVYEPRSGPSGAKDPNNRVTLLPEEVAHFSPIPDPVARFRGMSWITPLVREIEADTSATMHKRNFFENGATPGMAIKFDKDTDEDAFDEFVEGFKSSHTGSWNAYKTLFLMGGADVTPLSHDFRQMDFAATVGKSESRIAAAAGVPSSWVGFSEGMQGGGLNQGNYAAARRRFADGTIRPLWRMVAASIEPLVRLAEGSDVADGKSLWYDTRDVAFLREDESDRAEIMRIEANAIDAFIKAGFEPDAAVEAVRDKDINKVFGHHTGLVSVQMQAQKPEVNTNERDLEEANIRKVEADTISVLVTQGYSIESIAAFMETGDVTKLEKDPMKEQQEQLALEGQHASNQQAQAAARGQQQAANQPAAAGKPKPGAPAAAGKPKPADDKPAPKKGDNGAAK